MSFFASRKSTKGGSSRSTTTVQTVTKPVAASNGVSASSKPVAASSPKPSNNGGSPSTAGATTTTKLVTVTRKVNAADKPVSLKERQREAKSKRDAEEEQLRRRAALAAQRQRDAEESAERRRKALSKGKQRAEATQKLVVDDSSSGGEGQNSDEDESGKLGTPVSERKQPLRVIREDLAAPKDDLREFETISGAQLVESNRKAYAPHFEDIASDLRVRIEYPGDHAGEDFLLLRPSARDQEEYNPIQDIISTIRTICDFFLTAEQAQDLFKHVQHSSTSALGGDFDFLRAPTPAITRDATPISETGTPEPGAASSPNPLHREPLIRLLEKAYRRKNGTLFLSAVEWYNSTVVTLRESGKIRENIDKMGKTTGLPEAVWTHVSQQCYERTVGPRIDELKKYEAFSDNTYGELLPPFVAHIANLTGLKEGSVLVDMGSGVGNCVVQASLATGCKSYGFENQTQAADIAAAQLKELTARCRLWGIRSGPCETHDADFLAATSLVSPTFREADVILVNNYVFSSNTNESLSLMFLDLKDGAKIVSLKPFVHASGGTEITARNAYSPASILVQSKPLVYARNSVSWSAEDGTFYIATVNRDRLRRYLERQGA